MHRFNERKSSANVFFVFCIFVSWTTERMCEFLFDGEVDSFLLSAAAAAAALAAQFRLKRGLEKRMTAMHLSAPCFVY
jgi:hypothetical protein